MLTLGLRVLITNNALAERGGAETYVRDIATDLPKRGHLCSHSSTFPLYQALGAESLSAALTTTRFLIPKRKS